MPHPKILYTLSIIAFFSLYSVISLGADKKLTFSIHIDSQNLNYKKTQVIMGEAFRRIGYKIILAPYPGKRALFSSNQGYVDGEAHRIYGIINNNQYPNLIRIPETQFLIKNYAYTKMDIQLENAWESLTPYTVGVVSGYVFATNMSKKYARSVMEVNKKDQLFKLLKAGRIDIAIFGEEGILQLKTPEYHNSNIKALHPPLSSIAIYMYLHKKHKDLAVKAAASLHQMKIDGTYQKLWGTLIKEN